MKRILSTVLALVMVFAVMPISTLASGEVLVNTPETANMLISSDSTIKVENDNPMRKASARNVSSVGERTTEMPKRADIGYTDDELRAMSREELVTNTRDTLPNEFTPYEERLGYGETGLKDPHTSDDENIRRIIANKDKSEQKLLNNIEYGKKLASGEIVAESKLTAVDDVILITSEDDLIAMAGQDGYFRLVCDINLSQPWEPIDFYGTFEGAGHTISAATMEYPEYDYVGFFSYLSETAVVQNLNLAYPYVYANANAGALCGYNQGVIQNCHVENGTVVSYLWADFEYEFWNISGTNMGGLVGLNEGYIMDSSFTGDVDGWTSCGGICGCNAGYVFACFANGNVCYETNTWDYDAYGAEYFYYYGYEYYPPFTTYLRMQWAAYMLYYYGATAYGYNGGLVGQNYFAIFDCCVQGSGSGNNYNIGVVAGLDCVGGLVGGDAGWCSHCYVIDKAFPVLDDGVELYFPWDYGDAGYGIYYDYAYFLVHKGIALNYAEVTAEADEIFFYGTPGLPCEDGCYHGQELTAEEFTSASTFSNWNHGEWNNGDVWLIEDGYIPIITELIMMPQEYVVTYQTGNAGGLLDGDYVIYKLAHYDENVGAYIEPIPPVATDTQAGIGVAYWTPEAPAANKVISSDRVYTAYFGKVNDLIGDTNLDGRVNTADAAYLLRSISEGTTHLFSYQQKINSDTVYDGIINTGDVTRILQYCAGIIPGFR